MSQVGRISGPLLEENLLRLGQVRTSQENLAFRNDLNTTQLLYVDVQNDRIAINGSVPSHELHVTGTTRTTNLIVDNESSIDGRWTIENNNITLNVGDLKLKASEAIVLSNLETDGFSASDNYITTNDSDADMDLVPNGTGTVEVLSNLLVDGNIYTPNNITIGGDITFGETNQDSVVVNTDVDSNIVPDQTDTYDLGSINKRWLNLRTRLVNGEAITSLGLVADANDYNLRVGNIFYVAENGNDSNTGDHPLAPFNSIKRACQAADASTQGPVIIHVFPGGYEEECPIVVPSNVTITGHDIRNTIVRPESAYQSEDIFHLNGESTITNLTIKDFYYDSGNNTGYAFRFAPNAVTSTRSPYIQDVTVITQGTTTSADDPRGYASGDAGKGAWIDGAEMDTNTVEASMLFHSCTFITPGVDAITMTNGVRVEWLNSFTYFANRGLYAVDGITGRTSYDGSTVIYGAEVRSIGSANVYGNYGAVADGTDTLMYLIQHNMAYIGTGKYSNNDSSRVIQANEVVELNNGQIHYTTTDHTGSFRVGDNFLVDFETGGTTLSLDELTLDSLNGLIINTNGEDTKIEGGFVEVGNFNIVGNLIETAIGDINIQSATNEVDINANTNISGNLDITGNLTFDGSLNLLGNQTTDTLKFNVDFDQNLNPNTDSTFTLGTAQKQWINSWLSSANIGDTRFFDNVITTDTSNASLELRANGTGIILIPSNDVTITNATTVNGTTDLKDTNVTGTLAQTGNFNITVPSYDITGNIDVGQNLDISASAQFEEILIANNVVTTTTSNTDLELRANGTGKILVPNQNVTVTNNFEVKGSTFTSDINNAQQVEAVTFTNGDIEFTQNEIYTTLSNSDLELRATGDVFINDSVEITQDLRVLGSTTIETGVAVTVNGDISHTGAYNQTGSYTIGGELTVDNVYIEDNFITTLDVNGNLVISANGTGLIYIPDSVTFAQDLTVSTDTDLQGTTITGSLLHTGDTTHTGNITQGGELTVDNVYIEDNFITTTSGNLTLGATGDINVDANDVEIAQDLTVSGATSLQDTTITGTVTHTGNRTQTGNLDIAGEISNGNILIEDNFISTTNTNSDLELRASGTGEVVIDPSDTVTINNNLFVGGTLDYQGFLTINGNVNLQGNTQDGSLSVSENFTINGTIDVTKQAQFEEILIDDNFITTTSTNTDLELRANGTGNVLIPNNNVQIDTNLSAGSINSGNINISTDLVADEIATTDNNVTINDNYITTETSNANLELRATGIVTINSNDVVLTQNLTVNGNTDIDNTIINGNLTQTGDRIQTGNVNLTGDLTISGKFAISDQPFQFEDILVDGNVLTTTLSNSDFELRAAGTGNIILDSTIIRQDLSVGSLTVDAITIDDSVALENMVSSTDIDIFDNVITTTNSNSNLELRAAGTGFVRLQDFAIENDLIKTDSSDITLTTDNLIISSTDSIELPKNNPAIQGDISFDTTRNLFEGFGTAQTYFGGVYSSNARTRVVANNDNSINFYVNDVRVGGVVNNLVDATKDFEIHGLQVDDINIQNGTIQTNASNSNLDLRTTGTGEINLGQISLKDSTIKDNGNNLVIKSTGFGHTKFGGAIGVAVPYGSDAQRSPSPETGETRWNTDDQILETWDGNQYISAAGISAAITPQEFDDLLLEYTLIFG